MRLFITQQVFPPYRDKIWSYFISKKFVNHSLHLVQISSIASLKTCIYPHDSIVHSSLSCQPLLSYLRFICKFTRNRRYMFSQINYYRRRQNKFYLFKLFVYFLCVKFFTDNWITYYSFEHKCLPRFLKIIFRFNFSSLNNTVILTSTPIFSESSSILILGRATDKSKHDLIYSCINYLYKNSLLDSSVKFHFVGSNTFVSEETAATSFVTQTITYDQEVINEIAGQCGYLLYAGDVGLSIIHGALLGLIPIVHDNYDAHFPEATAIKDIIPTFHFAQDNFQSLLTTLLYAQNTTVSKTLRRKIHKTTYSNFGPDAFFVK